MSRMRNWIGTALLAACASAGGQSPVPASSRSVAPKSATIPLEQAIALLDQSHVQEAAEAFDAGLKSGAFPAAVRDYLLARAALARGELKEALQRTALVLVSGSRDPALIPAAVFLEGQVHRRSGAAEAARAAAEELKTGWPDSAWSRRAEELTAAER